MIHRLLTNKVRTCVKCGAKRHKSLMQYGKGKPYKNEPGRRRKCIKCPS